MNYFLEWNKKVDITNSLFLSHLPDYKYCTC